VVLDDVDLEAVLELDLLQVGELDLARLGRRRRVLVDPRRLLGDRRALLAPGVGDGGGGLALRLAAARGGESGDDEGGGVGMMGPG
jgi:hypothetical protein